MSLPVTLEAAVHPLLQDRYGSLLTALFAVWSELGVEVSVKTRDMASFLAAWQENEGLDLLAGRWNADYDDPDSFAYALFHTRAGHLRRYFSSAESDPILEEARAESRPAVRDVLYRKFENLLLESGAILPLFHDIDYRLASPKVRGLKLRGTAPYVNYPQIGKVESVGLGSEARRGGGVIQVPMAGVVTSLAAAQETLEAAEVLSAVFEPLTRDAGNARIVPWLAAEIKVEDGGQRYRFRLRDDVRFHDGRRLTARDVRYTFEHMFQAAGMDSGLLSFVRGARALIDGEAGDLAGFRIHSATEFSMELEGPVAFFPALLSNPSAAIIPEGSDPAAATGAPGTGPFRVAAFEPGRRLELESNKTYWRKGYPRCDGVFFTFGVDPKEMLSGFREGRFSLASDLFPADVEALRREAEFGSGYRESPRLITYFAAFNTTRGPLADKALRQRLVQAVDVPRLVRQSLGRLAIPAHGLIPPGLLGYERSPVSRVDSQPPDVAATPAATIELTAAVHPILFGGYAAIARELSTAFLEKGVKLRAMNQTMADYTELVRQGATDLVVGRWGADYPDSDTFVHIVHSREGFVGRYYASGEVDRLIERGRAESASHVRHSIYRQLEDLLARDSLLLPLFHEQVYRFGRPELEGLSVLLGIPTVRYESLYVRP